MFHGMEYVLAIWKTRSFSAAAKQLYISQPALSNSIRRLEDRLGAPIFDRSTNPIGLTEIGKQYISAAEQIQAIQENFSHYLDDIQNAQSGHISIGSGMMMASYLLPELIAGYKESFPMIDISVIEGDERTLERMLVDGIIDLLIENRSLPDHTFERQFYCTEHILLAVPKDWSLNQQMLPWQQSVENIISGAYLNPIYPTVDLGLFQDCPFVLNTPGDENYHRAITLCQNYHFVPQPILTLNHQLSSYNVACSGLGAVFVSDTLIRGSLYNQNMIYYKVDGQEAEREICFYFKRNRYLPRCVSKFLEFAKSRSQP